MRINGAFRFLICASAFLLWVGAVATAGEQSPADDEQAPPVEVAPPASADDDAAAEEEGGEAPAEQPEEGSEE
jgi:hypothetical protein